MQARESDKTCDPSGNLKWVTNSVRTPGVSFVFSVEVRLKVKIVDEFCGQR